MPSTLRLDYGLLGLRRRHVQWWDAAYNPVAISHGVFYVVAYRYATRPTFSQAVSEPGTEVI